MPGDIYPLHVITWACVTGNSVTVTHVVGIKITITQVVFLINVLALSTLCKDAFLL